jgi:hypothetical protein
MAASSSSSGMRVKSTVHRQTIQGGTSRKARLGEWRVYFEAWRLERLAVGGLWRVVSGDCGKEIKRRVTKRHQACLDSGSLDLGVSLSTLPRIILYQSAVLRSETYPSFAGLKPSATTLGLRLAAFGYVSPLDPVGIDDYLSRSLIYEAF